MENMLQYFFLTNMAVLLIFIIVASCSGYRLTFYIRKHHPEKAKNFGCPQGGWFNSFKFNRALYKQCDIEDPEFTRLKNRARNALKWMFMAALPMLLIFFLLIVAVIYHELLDLIEAISSIIKSG